ncbi:MAG: DUF4835 family protein [Fidelibacterota bacterium]
MMRNSPNKLILFCLLFVGGTYGQFQSIQLTLDDRMLRDSDRQALLTLESEVSRLFTQNIWDEDYSDLALRPSISLIFENTTAKGAITVFQCQALFSVGLDQRYLDKSVQFVYNSSSSLYFDPVVFDPLTSFLGYYAFILLAGEMDTYDPLAGTGAYEQAREIAMRGIISEYNKGWEARLNLIDELSSNFGLRRAKFAFYYGLDLIKDGELQEAANQFNHFIQGLKEALNASPRERYTLYFMNSHANEIADALQMLGLKDHLEEMILLDPDHEDRYGAALDQMSE